LLRREMTKLGVWLPPSLVRTEPSSIPGVPNPQLGQSASREPSSVKHLPGLVATVHSSTVSSTRTATSTTIKNETQEATPRALSPGVDVHVRSSRLENIQDKASAEDASKTEVETDPLLKICQTGCTKSSEDQQWR